MVEKLNWVLNLIINGLPSKQTLWNSNKVPKHLEVLNLIINGLPSKHYGLEFYVPTFP